jgi:hypothetical protein
LTLSIEEGEGDLEVFEDKVIIASSKLDKVSTAVDDSERLKKVFQIK